MNNIEIIHQLKEFVTDSRFKLFEKILNERTNYISLLIENVYQSHNASAIVRTAEALGLQELYVYERKNSFSPNEEISLGAQKWLDIYRYKESEITTAELFYQLKSKGYRIIATTLHEKAISLEQINLEKGKMLFLFGTEKEGLTDEFKSNADEFLKIPIYGFTESFNVSVSVGIILYQIISKLRQTHISYFLSNEEKNKIMIDWLVKSIPMGEKVLERIIKKGA
ncbi:MAG: RNA methyltransferase [Bacteroidales bacterium]|nr:RNA methyltransferase [Bacteroidales bacterium]